MALDVRGGDVLIVGGEEYPIRSCAAWAWQTTGRRGGMARMMTTLCDVQRAVIDTDGRLTAMATQERSLACLPLDPVEPELRERLGLKTPHELLQTMVDGGDTFYHLVIEKLRD